MPDIFDRIKKKEEKESLLYKPEKEKSDIFDRLAKKKKPDIFDKIAEKSKEVSEKKPSFTDRVKNYFKSDALGEAAVLQMKSGGFAGAPALTPEQGKKVAIDVGTIAIVEAAFAPIIGLAESSIIAPRILSSLARLTQAGTTGAAVATTGKLAEKGELPTKEELIKDGLTWVAIDALMQGLHLTAVGGYNFGKAVNDIAKKEGVPTTTVLGKLWDSTKNFVKSKFGRKINAPQDITPQDVEILVEQAKQAEKTGLKPAEITYEEPKKIEHKPEEKVSTTVPEGKNKILPKNQLERFEKGNIKYQPAGVVGDYIRNPEVREALKEVLDYPVRFHHPKIGPDAYYESGHPISISEENRNVHHFKEILFEEAIHALQDIRGRTSKALETQKNTPYHERKYEISAKKFANWASDLEEKTFNEILKKEKETRKQPIIPQIKIETTKVQKEKLFTIDKPVILKKPEDINIGWNVGKKTGEPFAAVRLLEGGVNEIILTDEEKKLVNKFAILERQDKTKWDKSRALDAKEKAQESIYNRITNSIKKEEEKTSTSGYEKRPIPETHEQKVAQLKSKIDDSLTYQRELKQAIIQNKQKLIDEELAVKNDPNNRELRSKSFEVRQQLQNKRDELIAEQKYVARLKADFKQLKAEGEKSKVQVPLGHREKPVQAKGHKETPPETERRRSVMGKEQAAKRSDVIKLFRKAFNDPIRLGKIRQGRGGLTRGEHELWSRVTRLLRDNDVETAAHEIGHNLHTTLYGGDAKTAKEQRANIVKALKPYLNELKNLAHYEPYTLEGFAEFTRLYVTNPEVARKLAPKFYQKFETDLDAQYPDLKNALLEARDYYESYLQGTPESRIDAQTDYGKDPSFLNNLINWVKDPINLDKLKTNFLDDVFPAKRLVAEAFGIPLTEVENLKDPRNLYRSLRVLKGAIGKADVFVLHETFDPLTLEKKGLGLRQILTQLPDEKAYKEFNRYLLARRVIEKSEQKILTGINRADALEVVKKLEPQYKELADELDKYNDALLHYVRKSGLLSQEQYIHIKQNNLLYVPFQRVMETEKGSRAATQGKLQAGKPIKRMKGSTRDIIAPLESIVKNTYSLIINSEKNMAGKVLAQLSEMKGVGKYVEHVPVPIHLKAKLSKEEVLEQMNKLFRQSGWMFDKDVMSSAELRIFEDVIKPLAEAMPDFFTRFGPGQYKKGESIITVYLNGKPSYYEVSQEIYEMWTKGIAPYTASLITKIARIPARTLRAGAILNPKFMMKNVVRDTWGGFLFTKYTNEIENPIEFFTDLLYSPLAMLMEAAKQGPLYVEWLKAGGGMSTMQALDRDSVVKKLEEVKHGYHPEQIIKWLRKFAEVSEEANRLAEFGRALKVEEKTRLGKEISAFAARDLSIDFAKMGLMTKAWNQVIPFFNATIQGSDKLVRTVTSKQDRSKFILRGIAYVTIPALILAWLNQNDDRIEELQEQEKDFNFVGFVGGTLLKIPVPFETGVLLNGLMRRMYNFVVKKDPEAFKGFMGSIMSAMMPNFIPSIAHPIVEAEANKNFFTGGRIIPASKEGLVSKYQYTNYTSITARLLGRAISYMVGQDTQNKYAAPAVIDHFINSWTGGLGRLVVSLADSGLELAGAGDKIIKPSRTILERLGLDAFIARYPRSNTKSIEEFYDNYQDAMARKKSINYAQKSGAETEKGLEAAYRRVDKLYDFPTLDRAYHAMQNCQKAINEIYMNPDIDADTKRNMIDDLYLQQIGFAKLANQDIKKYQLYKKD